MVLRAFGDQDVPVIQEAATDPLIPLITTVPTEPTAEAAHAFLERQHTRLTEGTGYSFAIADLNTDQALGHLGVWLRELHQGRAEIGYWVSPRHRGHGIAWRALHAASQWSLQLPGVFRLQLHIEPDNTSSWRVAERAGYQREGLLRGWQTVGDQRRDMYVYSLLASDLP